MSTQVKKWTNRIKKAKTRMNVREHKLIIKMIVRVLVLVSYILQIIKYYYEEA